MHSEAQRAGIRKTLTFLLGAIALMVGLIVSNYLHRDTTLSRESAAKLGFIRFEQPRSIDLPTLAFQDGSPVTQSAFVGGWNFLYFGFTACPDICPTTLAVMNKALPDDLQEDLRIVLVTVDPERDTPEQLQQYLAGFNRDFIGVTGDHEDIARFATQVNVAFGKIPGAEKGSYTMDHTGSIVVMDPQGDYAGFIKAPHRPEQLREIMLGL